MRTSLEEYDPTLRGLIKKAPRDWGNWQENRLGLIPYPGGDDSLLNTALWGIDIKNGELIGIIGMEKARKTTFAVNIFYGIHTQALPVVKPRIAYLTLESGQPPERVRDLFVSMAATELMFRRGQRGDAEISPEFLRYQRRSPIQQRAIDDAMAACSEWNISIYGPRKDQGNTRSMDSINRIVEREAEAGCQLICLDHAQQVHVPNTTSSMQQLYAVVDLFAGAIVRHGIAGILISQVSLTSMRGARTGTDRLRAVGGKRLDEESTVVFETKEYEGRADKLWIYMLTSRRAPPFKVIQTLDPSSGLFIGAPRTPEDEEALETHRMLEGLDGF